MILYLYDDDSKIFNIGRIDNMITLDDIITLLEIWILPNNNNNNNKSHDLLIDYNEIIQSIPSTNSIRSHHNNKNDYDFKTFCSICTYVMKQVES